MLKKKFGRKPGFQLKADPQTVGEVCQKLEQIGKLSNKNLVAVSRPKNAPLHNDFEWDDKVAAEKYREEKAGYIIRSVTVEVTELPTTVTHIDLEVVDVKGVTSRYFHSLGNETYESLDTISEDEDKINKLKKSCIKDLKSFISKYVILSNVFPNLFESLDAVLKEIENE